MTTKHRFRRHPLTALIATLAAGSAIAQDATPPAAPPEPAAQTQELGAVTVRSRNRIEKLQDVPLSISVIQGDELSRLSATGIEEITKRAGNVSWNLGNQRTSSLSIRGIGKVGQTEAQDPSVGVIVDGVSFAYNALTSSFDFIDIDTIEVSRGPQGTLLGKNTSVGNVIFNTKKPSFTPTADYGLTFYPESRGLQAWAAVGGPIADNVLAWRGTFSVQRAEGDIQNQYNRNVTYTNKDRVSGRVQFLYRPSEDFNAIARFELQPRAAETTNGRTFNFANTHTYLDGSAIPASATSTENRLARRWFSQVKSYTVDDYYNTLNNDAARGVVTGSSGASLEANWKVAGEHTLTSITAFKNYHFNAVNDEGTPFDIARNSGGYWNDYKQVSQELRISSAAGGFVDYQGGVYLLRVKNSAEYDRIWGNDAGAWYASASQYTTLDADGAGRYLLANSLANVKAAVNSTPGVQFIDNRSAAVFGQANWHFSPALTLTTGLRITREDRRNLTSSELLDPGSAPELNPVSITNTALGGFANDASGNLTGDNSATQLALADATALKYFNVPTYGALTTNQKKQVAAAKAVRLGQLGVLYEPRWAEPYKATQPSYTLSPSYKFTKDVTGYAAYQHGEKAGIAQAYNGESYPVKAEKTDNIELGFKSLLLNRTLILNADVFLTRIKDYQQAVRVFDVYNTNLNIANGVTPPGVYASITGNVPKVQVSGLEFDGVYNGIRDVSLRFSGAYNKAVYKDFKNGAYPVEEGNVVSATNPYKDYSGQSLAGAPRFSWNVGADYRLPVWGDKLFHVTGNLAYTGAFLSDNAGSIYSRIPASYRVDLALGLGKINKTFDVSLLAKNLFNDDTPQSLTWTSRSPAVPRTVGIQLTGKL
ncbi:MAG: TonB-dependent receptor [Rubrivivax sp.]|nr:MAG: TonB-dependent receptor [Rubrivivax sp.]